MKDLEILRLFTLLMCELLASLPKPNLWARFENGDK